MSLSLAGNGTITGVDADASGLLSELGGIGSNVASVTKTDVFAANIATNTFVAVTGLSVNFTPTSSSAKVLLLVSVSASHQQGGWCRFRVTRDGTPIFVGDADGSHPQLTGTSLSTVSTNSDDQSPGLLLAVDSPATSSQVTYAVELHNQESTTQSVYCNRSTRDPNDRLGGRTISTITAVEVAA